jgi:hypothetical protein
LRNQAAGYFTPRVSTEPYRNLNRSEIAEGVAEKFAKQQRADVAICLTAKPTADYEIVRAHKHLILSQSSVRRPR